MNRKKFIQNLSWVIGGISISGCASVKGAGVAGKKISGSVLVNKRGLAGVVVSDGVSVVTTNAKGIFEMTLHDKATHVFVSTPSGYAFKEEKWITKNYSVIGSTSNGARLVFELTALPKDDNEHHFIVWADPQVKSKSDVEKMMTTSVPDVIKTINSIGKDELIHGITVGDIVWDNHDLFKDYISAVGKMGIPFFQCLGNHDMDYNNVGDEGSDTTFKSHFGPTYYSFNRGKVHYVVMDNVRYLGKDKDYDGYIQEQQLDWLQKDLAFVPIDNLIVLCVHILVHKGTKNNDALYAILKDRQTHIMSGHTHYHVNKVTGNVYEHNHGTVCGAWWTGAICEDGTPNGYGVYKVKGTDIRWHYQATGMPASHQMTIYTKDYNAEQKQVIVNIWNYDDAWQTKCEVDGSDHTEPLVAFEGWDPLASTTMLGPELPIKRSFAEPKLTKHIFKTMVPVSAKEVVIHVTDRFGNVYSEKKDLG